MLSEEMYQMGSKSSVIREIFVYGQNRKAEIGADQVFDFSLGNPSIPAPDAVRQAIVELAGEPAEQIHAYTVAQGAPEVRQAIADSLNRRFQTHFRKENLYMTTGAAASLNITFKALAVPGDEFITFAPFFPEYRCWVEGVGAKLLVTPAETEHFQIHFEALEQLLSENTKGVIINSPNNPSGVVYSEEVIERLAELLRKKEKEYGHPIYLIADEPYREIVYDGLKVPFLTKYYADTIVCYSYSKSLSLPGERIGYILIPDEAADAERLYAAVCGAGRVLGFVCAPVFFQQVIGKCVDVSGDIDAYDKNRKLLYEGLMQAGYRCILPQGAFYLFVESPEPDANAFCERAKKYELLLVPGDDFGCPGFVRIAYCVTEKQIRDSLPAFEKLMGEYR